MSDVSSLRIAQHQNGFMKVELPLGGRLHVWSPWNPPVDDFAPIHDHPFSFDSTCLAGEMINVELEPVEDELGVWLEHSAMCVSSFEPQPALTCNRRRFKMLDTRVTVVRRGESYSMRPGVLHRTDAVFALTLFKKGEQIPGHSRVFAHRAASAAESFEQPQQSVLRIALHQALLAARLSVDDVIEIERQLNERFQTPAASKMSLLSPAKDPGYHLVDIPKSPHGTPQKVLEEAMELCDAHAQGVKMMTAQECSDVLLALRSFVAGGSVGAEFADIEAMARVTERAFVSGRRK